MRVNGDGSEAGVEFQERKGENKKKKLNEIAKRLQMKKNERREGENGDSDRVGDF